jgi:hypothetical protein
VLSFSTNNELFDFYEKLGNFIQDNCMGKMWLNLYLICCIWKGGYLLISVLYIYLIIGFFLAYLIPYSDSAPTRDRIKVIFGWRLYPILFTKGVENRWF